MSWVPTVIDAGLLVAGSVVMALSLAYTRRLLEVLPADHGRRQWRVLVALMVVFLAGYLAALAAVVGGEWVWIERITALVFALGAVFVFVVVHASVDLGRRLLAELAERERVEAGLREAVRHRDDFLSVASHELKTPVTAMLLRAQIRERRATVPGGTPQTGPEVATESRDEQRQIRRLNRLIDDMLDVSRIAAGRLRLVAEEVDLGGLVADVVGQHGPQLEDAGCATSLELEPGVVGTWDRQRLEQVVTNLVTNAIRYGAGAPVRASVRRRDAEAVVEVEDRGRGIAPDDLPRIFQQYERVGDTGQVRGLGLGLYIVRQLVEAHHGRIEVTSRLGEGSTFRVVLPLRPP